MRGYGVVWSSIPASGDPFRKSVNGKLKGSEIAGDLGSNLEMSENPSNPI